MSKTLTYELPDEVFEALRTMADKSGVPVEDLAVDWLARHAHRSASALTGAASEKAWSRLRRFAGAADSGDPQSADNQHIDADLAREHNGSHHKAR